MTVSSSARTMGCAVLLLVALVTTASPAPKPESADVRVATRLVASYDSLRVALGIPGLGVAILRDTTVLEMRGLGMADPERGLPVTPNTPFNIASVSKPISAVVALRLVEQGILDLDRPMRSYADFDEFCADARARGGIFFRDVACTDSALTLRHVLSMTANGVPGHRFWYNPPLFSWASRPMAEVSGRPFSDLVADLVFRPAGMTRSARTHRRLSLPAAMLDSLARPHHLDSTGTAVASEAPPPQGDGAAGGVVSSVADLARFDIALTRGTLLRPESRRALWTSGRDSSGRALPYGLGWFIGTLDGTEAVWHTGLWEGAYSALYLKIPARRLTLVLLANSDALRWEWNLDEAVIERSPFAKMLASAFPK